MDQLIKRLSLAISRPNLLLRKIRGQELIEIDLHEIEPYLGDSPVILEAGACNGEDTVKFAERWPQATIHAFEPVPELFRVVERRTSHFSRVYRYPLALSDRTGSATMYISDKDGGHRDSSSLMTPAEHLVDYPRIKFTQSITVQTTTINDWAAREGIDRVDFMWLDMQGMELRSLKAAGSILPTTAAICMEVACKEMYRGCPLYDEVISWMRGRGFIPAIDRVVLSFGNILFVRR
jgi:2-O-methyltransferase